MLQSFWQWLENTELAQTIAGSEWIFPTLETLHVIFIVTVVGSIAIVDLRLLGLTGRNQAVTSLSRDTLPITWVAFAGALITGGLLFASKATQYMVNPYFITKISLILLAGVNMLVLHFLNWRDIAKWDKGQAPAAVKLAGGISLAFWVIVVFCGRVIGFTLGIYHT